MSNNNFRKPNSLLDQEKHVIEYTSGQFIFAICIALGVALFCFLMGMVVKATSHPQVASTTAPGESASKPAEPAAKPAPAPARNTGPKKEGQQTSPSPNVLNSVKPPAPKPAATTPPPTPETAPRAVNLPPLDPNQKNAPQPAASTPAPKNSTEPTKPPTSTPPTQTTKATESPKKEVASPPPNKAQSESVLAKEIAPLSKTPEKSPERAPGSAPTIGGEKSSAGGFTIQLAAFTATEASKAEAYKTSLEKHTDLKPEVIRSKDGKVVRVVTGAFADRAAADKAREELAKKGEFVKCFVRARE